MPCLVCVKSDMKLSRSAPATIGILHHKFDSSSRQKLVKTLQNLAFDSPVTRALLPICTQGDQRSAILEKSDVACILASDLNYSDGLCILVSTLDVLRATGTPSKTPYVLSSSNWATALLNTMLSWSSNPTRATNEKKTLGRQLELIGYLDAHLVSYRPLMSDIVDIRGLLAAL